MYWSLIALPFFWPQELPTKFDLCFDNLISPKYVFCKKFFGENHWGFLLQLAVFIRTRLKFSFSEWFEQTNIQSLHHSTCFLQVKHKEPREHLTVQIHQRQQTLSVVFIVNFEHISNLFYCLCYLLWTGKFMLEKKQLQRGILKKYFVKLLTWNCIKFYGQKFSGYYRNQEFD